jgi:hypothetical protein
MQQNQAQPNEPPVSGYSTDQLQSIMAQALSRGNSKVAAQAESLLKMNQAQDAKTQAAQKLSMTQQRPLLAVKNAAQAIDQLQQLFNQAGGAASIAKGNFRDLMSKAGLNPDVASYNDLQSTVTALLTQALVSSGGRAGASVQLNKQIKDAIPQITDRPATARTKLNTLRGILQEAYTNAIQVPTVTNNPIDLSQLNPSLMSSPTDTSQLGLPSTPYGINSNPLSLPTGQ